MPPSENAIYRNKVRGERGSGRKLTQEARNYYAQCEQWKALNFSKVQLLDTKFAKVFDSFSLLRVRFLLHFPMFEVFTDDGMPKKMDATNRLKIMQDSVSQMFNFDDRMIFDARVEKLCLDKDALDKGLSRGVTIIFEPMRARTSTQALNDLLEAVHEGKV